MVANVEALVVGVVETDAVVGATVVARSGTPVDILKLLRIFAAVKVYVQCNSIKIWSKIALILTNTDGGYINFEGGGLAGNSSGKI